MHHFSCITKLRLALTTMLIVASAYASPDENSQQNLIRRASDGLTMTAQLTQNEYRQEPYEDNYTVQVPYQAEETYYVDVPYEVQESYTDYETYYENEWVCHNYTEYERRCHTERDCDKTPHPLNVIARPAPYPGNGGGGGGPVTPRPRPEPYPGNGGGGGGGGPVRPDPRPQPPRCYDRQVCNDIPVTRQRCGYENVSRTRPVTKYRTVTKYRSEARTRTVTRYRSEERCCVTKYRDIFDHQWALDVQIQLPQGTELFGTEQERFSIELTGSESAPDIDLTPASTIFGYRIATKKVENGVATITLSQIPRYKRADLAEKSLQSFTAVPSAKGLSFKFLNNAIYPRVASRYQVQVEDSVSHEVMARTEVLSMNQRENSGELVVNWDYTRNYNVVLKVHREGAVIENGAVDFELRQPLQMVLDMAALKDENRISVDLSGTGAHSQIKVKDDTVPYVTVSTRYYISIVRKTILGKKSVVAEKGFSRTSLKANTQGYFMVNVSEFGAKTSDLQRYLKSGEKVKIVVQVDRVTPDNQKIQFWKSASIVVR